MDNLKHSELSPRVVCQRTYYAGDFYTEYRKDGWYAIRCDKNKLTPISAVAIGPCVSEKQACYLFCRKFNR